MKNTIRTLFVLLLLALLLPLSADAFAEAPLELDKTGSITVSATDGQSIGTRLTLYCVAETAADGESFRYVLTPDFAGSNAELTSLDEAKELAAELFAYAAENNLSGTTRAVGENGSVTFEDIIPGLYLIIQELAQPGASLVNPFLVSLPVLSDSGEWEYDVDARPKLETFELIDITVKKVWNDGNDTASRPSKVTVTLYRDGTAIDSVKLGSSNNWSHTWTGLAKGEGYSVVETQLSEYVTTYSQSGLYSFTIINTPKLAQTGQLNWPIPLLAGGGILLFALGWALVFLKRKNDA